VLLAFTILQNIIIVSQTTSCIVSFNFLCSAAKSSFKGGQFEDFSSRRIPKCG